MSQEFEEQSHHADAICPYCLSSYQVESEDYSEDIREEECEECGNTYWIEQSFSVETTTKPDCELNGASHKWELMTFADGKSAFFCSVCNECSLVADDGTPLAEKSKGEAE